MHECDNGASNPLRNFYERHFVLSPLNNVIVNELLM